MELYCDFVLRGQNLRVVSLVNMNDYISDEFVFEFEKGICSKSNTNTTLQEILQKTFPQASFTVIMLMMRLCPTPMQKVM